MENKGLKHGRNNGINILNKKDVFGSSENQNEIKENTSGLNDIKSSLKKKHSHTSCKGCDGICCSKKDADKVQANG